MQNTIKKEIKWKGKGIHTGEMTTLWLRPAPPNSGIVFYKNKKKIPATVENVQKVSQGVVLGRDGCYIKTCEHLLSALYGMEVDNVVCEVEGEEIPSMDGSSREFVKEIEIEEQKEKKKEIRIKEKIYVEERGGVIFITPYEGFKITFCINYPQLSPPTQLIDMIITKENYLKEISPARTYVFMDWISHLEEKGLIKGGNFSNAIVINENGPLNTLRFQDELVRHKVLDLIGDLALVGRRIKGWVVGVKSGHRLNVKLAKRIRDGIWD